MYNNIVQEYFFSPAHVGVLNLDEPFGAHYRSNLAGQGVVIDLYVQCTPAKDVNRVCFKANGNPYLIAALEWISRQLEGRNLDSLPQINHQMLVEQLDIPHQLYPVAIQVDTIYKEVILLLNKQFER